MKRYKISNKLVNRDDIDVCFIEYGYDETEHMHDGIELLYIVSGSATNIVNGESRFVGRGSLILLDYDCVHSTEIFQNLKYYNVLFKSSFLYGNRDKELNLKQLLKKYYRYDLTKDYICVDFNEAQTSVVEDLFYSLLCEAIDKKSRSEDLMHCYFDTIINLLIRKAGEYTVSRDDITLNEAIEYIASKCNEKLSLDEVAKRYHYNPRYFSSILKRYCGLSFKQLVQRRRLNTAVYYLWTTDDTIDTIARRCGFENLSYFYELFDKVYGVKPRFVREYHKNYTKYLELKVTQREFNVLMEHTEEV